MTAEPRASRPRFPRGYGIATDPDGLLPWSWALERLVASRTYWVVSATPDRGPHAAPVWALWHDAAVVFSTSRESRKGRNLERDSRVVVHLESGDEVVIVHGRAEETALVDALADAYEAKYAFRPEPSGGLWLRVRPRSVLAWLESDYPRTATRFVFD